MLSGREILDEVLAPHVAMLLIKEDQAVHRERALEIMRESVTYGMQMFKMALVKAGQNTCPTRQELKVTYFLLSLVISSTRAATS